MKKLIHAGLGLYFLLIAFTVSANDSTGVRFSFDKHRINDKEVLLTIKAIVSGVKLYGLQHSENDALYSSIAFDSSATKYLMEPVTQKGNRQSEKDPSLEVTAHYFPTRCCGSKRYMLRQTIVCC